MDRSTQPSGTKEWREGFLHLDLNSTSAYDRDSHIVACSYSDPRPTRQSLGLANATMKSGAYHYVIVDLPNKLAQDFSLNLDSD